MAKHIKRGGQRNWSNISPSEISSAQWPFRYCDIEDVKSCEEVFGIELWDQIQAKQNRFECISSWNGKQMRKSRQMISRCECVNPHDQARNLFSLLLMRHFEDSFLSQQEIRLQPFEIYVAPGYYVEYKPQVDICLLDPTNDRTICLKIIEISSKQDIEDSLYQTMFSTLSGCKSTAYCFVIQETFRACFKVYVGKVEWPVEMLQMMKICGSDVSRQLGFNHRIHSRSIVAKYAYLGTLNCNEDDCVAVSLFLNTIDTLSSIDEPHFLPLTKSMQSVVDKRKTTHKHLSKCIFESEKVCNDKFEESASREDTVFVSY